MSGALNPIGIVTGPMSEYFGRPITEMAALFSWLTVGILIGSFLSLFVFEQLPIKWIMVAVYGLIAVSILALALTPNLTVIRIALGAVGVCSGVGLAGSAIIISHLFSGDRRASMLVITDASFSMAGIVCSWLAIFLLAQGFIWAGAFQLVAVVAAAIVVMALVSEFPEARVSRVAQASGQSTKNTTEQLKEPWSLSVWLCITGLFLYTMGQYSLLWWLPNYYETELGAPPDLAGAVVGQFWSGMFVAQLFVAWWVLKIGVSRLVLIGVVATAIGSIPLWVVDNIKALIVLAFIWGFANLALLKIIISFAATLVKVPSARLISALLFGATSGTAVSPLITSQLVDYFGTYCVLLFGSGCYLVLAGLIFLAHRLPRPENTNE